MVDLRATLAGLMELFKAGEIRAMLSMYNLWSDCYVYVVGLGVFSPCVWGTGGEQRRRLDRAIIEGLWNARHAGYL